MPKGNTELYERPRAVAQEMMEPDRHESRMLTPREQDLVTNAAVRSGGIAALATGAVIGGMVYAANVFSPRFRGALGVSGKTALVVTPTAFSFFSESHLLVGNATKDPSSYITAAAAKTPVVSTATPGTAVKLPAWYGVANVLYEHPFKTIIGCAPPGAPTRCQGCSLPPSPSPSPSCDLGLTGATCRAHMLLRLAVPSYSALFYHESTSSATANMPLSQRLIHTRVYGQAMVILITAGVMMFSKSMEDRGAYRLHRGHIVREADVAQQQRRRQWYETDKMAVEGAAGAAADDSVIERVEQVGLSTDLLVPLLYAPLLPLIVIGGRGRLAPDKLNKIAAGVIGVGLFHAGTIMFTDSTMTMD